jgi:hypothetical protein
MAIKEKYTTEDLIKVQTNLFSTMKPEDIPKDIILESSKTVLSNDAMAISELLECLINRGLR